MTVLQMSGQLAGFEVPKLTKYTKCLIQGPNCQTSRCEDQKKSQVALMSKTSCCGFSTMVSTMVIKTRVIIIQVKCKFLFKKMGRGWFPVIDRTADQIMKCHVFQVSQKHSEMRQSSNSAVFANPSTFAILKVGRNTNCQKILKFQAARQDILIPV